MPPIFPSNYTYPKQGYIIPFPKPMHQEKYYIFDDNTIESIINTVITPEEQKEIESLTFLPLVDLVKPGVKKYKDKVPRSQNVFVIFRKDQQARLTFEKGPSFTSQLKQVSAIVSKLWKEAPVEQKTLYDRISYITKQVHKHLWPNYSYKPNRRENRCNFPPLLPPPRTIPYSSTPYPPTPYPPTPYPPTSYSSISYSPTPYPSTPYSSIPSNSSSSLPQFHQYKSLPPLFPISSYYSPKYPQHQNRVLPSLISSFSPPPRYQNNTPLLEINPSNTMNEQYDKWLRNSLNKFTQLSL
ncbi:hypothetical protein RclHR1_02210006 [Rhizophagus clarus]|uniref:HMG box factor n=1 Tax=Rhizophagus clarus TaxID=94130 RepID=A0A2Z6R9P6_9GLOM|nr:hypothetical protein RclHR1_02210006 [Rhizophagus clarus]GET00182.1 HMG box factor [Rhizophagus clarus]